MKIKLFSLCSLVIGFLMLNSSLRVTGAFIGTSNNPPFSAFFGMIIIIASLLFFSGADNLEEKLKVKSFRRKMEEIEGRKIPYDEAKRGYNSKEARRLALSGRIPLDYAVREMEEANKKVESGEWVEIYREEPRYATGKGYAQNMSSSITRYYAPPEYRDVSSKKKADKLVKQGIAGKMHEIIVPSATDYNNLPEEEIPAEETRSYKKENGKWRRKTASGGKDFLGPMPNPSEDYTAGESSAGARPLHRHWEIEKLYKAKYGKK